jgi:hypothetical protein
MAVIFKSDFDLEDGDNMLLRNVGIRPPDYTVSHRSRLQYEVWSCGGLYRFRINSEKTNS